MKKNLVLMLWDPLTGRICIHFVSCSHFSVQMPPQEISMNRGSQVTLTSGKFRS